MVTSLSSHMILSNKCRDKNKIKVIAKCSVNTEFLTLLYHFHFTGDIKSQATPTEAHSVVESRPAMSEPASHSLHHKTSTTTTSKTVLSSGMSKNMLGLSTQPVIGAPTYIQHTTSTSPHLTSVSRFVVIMCYLYVLHVQLSRTMN